MASIDKKVGEFFTPNYHIKDSAEFWSRTKKYIVNNKEIESILNEAAPENKLKMMDSLERLAKENFDTIGKEYFNKSHWPSSVARYGALGAGVLGGIGVIDGILLAAGGAGLLGAGGAILGVPLLAASAGLNLLADWYDSSQAYNAVKKGEENVGLLGYVKKTAQGAWDFVTSPFKKKTLKPTLEGVVSNGIAYQGAAVLGDVAVRAMDYLPQVLNVLPAAQVATLSAIPISFYRGRKKFQEVVIDYIREKTQHEFLGMYKAQERDNVISLHDRMPVDPTDSTLYDVTKQPAAQLGYVSPGQRKAA